MEKICPKYDPLALLSINLCWIMIILFFIPLISPFILAAHEIHMKDGRIFKTETFWENDDEILFDKYDTTIYLDKNKVEKIVKKIDDTSSNEIKEKLKKKFNTNGAIIFLKDGRTIIAKKTSIEGDLVSCTTDDATIFFEENEINQIAKIDKKSTAENQTNFPKMPVRINKNNLQRNTQSDVFESIRLKPMVFKEVRVRCQCCGGGGIKRGVYRGSGPLPPCYCCGGTGRKYVMKWVRPE